MTMSLEQFRSAVRRQLAPLESRVLATASRGVVRLVDNGPRMQTVQVEVLKGDVRDLVEHFEPAGFTSTPKPGAEAIVLALGGDRSHSVAIVVGDRRYRLAGVEEGAVALHNEDGSASLVLRANGDVEVSCQKFRVDAANGIDLDPGSGVLNLGLP